MRWKDPLERILNFSHLFDYDRYDNISQDDVGNENLSKSHLSHNEMELLVQFKNNLDVCLDIYFQRRGSWSLLGQYNYSTVDMPNPTYPTNAKRGYNQDDSEYSQGVSPCHEWGFRARTPVLTTSNGGYRVLTSSTVRGSLLLSCRPRTMNTR